MSARGKLYGVYCFPLPYPPSVAALGGESLGDDLVHLAVMMRLTSRPAFLLQLLQVEQSKTIVVLPSPSKRRLRQTGCLSFSCRATLARWAMTRSALGWISRRSAGIDFFGGVAWATVPRARIMALRQMMRASRLVFKVLSWFAPGLGRLGHINSHIYELI